MKKLILISFAIFLSATEAQPQWSNNDAVNTTICNAAGDQATPKIASTSDGGCYIMWFDNRIPNYAVYLQKLDAAGVELFTPQGILISNNAQNTSLQDFNIDVDASDNAVIVFTDRRNGAQLNPFAYLISPTGTFLWGANGVSLTDSTSLSQNIPVVTATSDGNYVFAWTISTTPNRIALQKLNSAGVPQWGASPIKLRGSGTENFSFARLVKSNAGSVIMSWDNWIGNITTTSTVKIFIQKFSSTGTNLWSSPQDTVQNLGRCAGISFIQNLVSDGQDGALVCWVDDRDANARQSVWAQRFNPSGVIQFPKNGSEGSTLSSNNHFTPTVTYLQPTGETVMFWTETNGGQTIVGGLYGQKFDATGNMQWGSNGKEFKTLDNNQLSFLAAYSKDTNVVVSYTQAQFGSGNSLVKAIRTGPSSAFYWPGDTVVVSSSSGSKIRKQAIMDKNSGNSVMVWSNGDIIAQNVKFNGELGVDIINLKFGIEGFWNGTVQVSDTLRLYLRNSSSPYNIIDSAKTVLNSNGEGIFAFPNAPSGTYYISTRHRNALETWSGTAIVVVKGNNSYDFTTSSSQAYGNNIVLKSSRYCAYSGDVNHDGSVDLADGSLVDNDVYNFVSGYVDTDVNGDNTTDISDLSIVDNNTYNIVTLMRP